MKVYLEVARDAQTSAVPIEAKRPYISSVCQHITTVEVEVHSHDCAYLTFRNFSCAAPRELFGGNGESVWR